MKRSIRTHLLFWACCLAALHVEAQNIRPINDAAFRDVSSGPEGIRKIIGDKRIILIGERKHSDTSAANYHTAMIDQLIAEDRVDLVLSEQPYCSSSRLDYTRGSIDTVPRSPRQQWLETLSQRWNIRHNGVDCGIIAVADQDLLLLANECGIAADLEISLSWKNWLKLFKELPTRKWDKDLSVEYGNACALLHQTISSLSSDDHESEFLHRYLSSTFDELHFYVTYWAKAMKQDTHMTSSLNNYRDSVMASNIEYFIRTSEPGSTVVILMSNYHVMRNAALIESGIGEKKSRIKTTGDWLFEKFGDEVYSIATINYKDPLQRLWEQPGAGSGRSDQSIEFELLNACSEDPCFVDISSETRSWIMTPTFRKKNLRAPWGEIYDGLLFFKEL